MPSDAALLIIDVQVGCFAEENPPHRGAELLAKISELAASARAANVAVIYIQHDGGRAKKDGPGWPVHPSIAPITGDRIVEKRFSNSFQETTLGETLASMNIHRLFVAGLQTEYCAGASCLAAKAFGYDVTLVSDAHTTWSSPVVSAEKMIELCSEIFSANGIELKPAAEIRF